ADLIGIPLRLTVGSRVLKEGGIEAKIRYETEKQLIPIDEAVQKVKEIIQEMYAEVEQNLETVEFNA
ncbi:MAG: His/Gly/Thr/Pro-type tRNA ligase C-terminal domain-containing protein, partial [Anaerolineales bacterium]